MGAARDPLHPASGLSISTPRGTQTRRALGSAGRVDVPAIIGTAPMGCQTPSAGATRHPTKASSWRSAPVLLAGARGGPDGAILTPGQRWIGTSGRPRTDTPQEYPTNPAGTSCGPPRAGAILRGPPAPGSTVATSGTLRRSPWSGPPPAREARRTSSAPRFPRARTLVAATRQPSTSEPLGHVEYGREASLARCPR